MNKIVLMIMIIVGIFYVNANARVFSRDVTFTEDIKPIFQKHCSSCHFGAVEYTSAFKNKDRIYNKFVRLRSMPPKYVNTRPNEAELLLVKQWIETGAKQ